MLRKSKETFWLLSRMRTQPSSFCVLPSIQSLPLAAQARGLSHFLKLVKDKGTEAGAWAATWLSLLGHSVVGGSQFMHTQSWD